MSDDPTPDPVLSAIATTLNDPDAYPLMHSEAFELLLHRFWSAGQRGVDYRKFCDDREQFLKLMYGDAP